MWAHALNLRSIAWAEATVHCLAWLVLGQLGMRMGWGWAGGLAGVAAWWALRQVWTYLPWPDSLGFFLRPLSLASMATAGLILISLLGRSTLGLMGWGLATVAWAGLAASVQRSARMNASAVPDHASHRLVMPVAAAMAWWIAGDPDQWSQRWWLAIPVLYFAAAGLHRGQRLDPHLNEPRCGDRYFGVCAASQWSMGLMMGSLFLHAHWCQQAGWPVSDLIALHLGIMVFLPLLLQTFIPLMAASLVRRGSAILLASGGMVAVLDISPNHLMLSMVLQTMAWALTTLTSDRSTSPKDHSSGPAWLLALCGPVLLVFMGWASSWWGPVAMAAVHAGLGLIGLAAAGLDMLMNVTNGPERKYIPKKVSRT